jgi:glycosyltransferase involved in cell wall biosynthesis
MIRVLYVNHSADLDGATQVLVNVIGSFDSGRITPLVLLPRNGPITERFTAAGIPHKVIAVGHCRWDMYHVPMLHMLLREEKIDVIHANTLESYPAIVAAKLCGVPVLWHIHEMISHVHYYAHAFRHVDDKIFDNLVSACSLICTASEASRGAFIEYCTGRGIDATDKVRAIHNGLTLPDVSTSPESPERFVITGIGNMVSVKGWNYLIEAYAGLLKDYPNTELNIVGQVFPGYFFDLYDVAEARGVADRVKFLTETPDIARVYRESDIIVCSSLMETFPMVVLEAMSYAKPIVATDVGGVKEMITDRETGILASPGDPASLAAGIKRYLDNWEEAIEVGKRARQKVEKDFSLADQVQAFSSIYETLADERPRVFSDSWSLEEIKELFLAHMIGESEKIQRLEEYFEDTLNQRHYYMEQQLRYLEERDEHHVKYLEERDEQHLQYLQDVLNQNAEERANLIRDLRTLEDVVNRFVSQWPFRLMSRIKRIFKKT